MIKSQANVLFNNGSLSIESQNFESCTKSRHQDSEEEKSTALEEASRIGSQVVKDGRDNESDGGVSEKLGDGKFGIGFETPETSL